MEPDDMLLSACPSGGKTLRTNFTASLSLISPLRGGGLSKYLYTYRTEGQLPYDTIDISANGQFIALIETPIAMPDETLRGGNRVHIIR